MLRKIRYSIIGILLLLLVFLNLNSLKLLCLLLLSIPSFSILVLMFVLFIPEFKKFFVKCFSVIKGNFFHILLTVLGIFFLTFPILNIFVYKSEQHFIDSFLMGILILFRKNIFKDFSFRKFVDFIKNTFESLQFKDLKVAIRKLENDVAKVNNEINENNSQTIKEDNIHTEKIREIKKIENSQHNFLNNLANGNSKIQIIQLWVSIESKIKMLATLCNINTSMGFIDIITSLRNDRYLKESEFKLIVDFYNVRNQVVHSSGKSLDYPVINIGTQIIGFLDNKIFITSDEIRRNLAINKLENMSIEDLFREMNTTIVGRPSLLNEYNYFLKKSREAFGEEATFEKLIADFDNQPIFKKDQIYCAVCRIFQNTLRFPEKFSSDFKEKVLDFVKKNKDGNISDVNRAEALFVRLTDKLMVLKDKITLIEIYNSINIDITINQNFLSCLREYSMNSIWNLIKDNQDSVFERLSNISNQDLENLILRLAKLEKDIDEKYQNAYSQLSDDKKYIYGFSHYASDDTQPFIYRNIRHNLGITDDFTLRLGNEQNTKS